MGKNRNGIRRGKKFWTAQNFSPRTITGGTRGKDAQHTWNTRDNPVCKMSHDKTNHMVMMTCIPSKLKIEMFWPTISHSNLTAAARRQLNTGMDIYVDVMRMIVGVQTISKTLAQHVTLYSGGVFKKRGGGRCAKQRCYFGCSFGSTIVFFTITHKK